MNAAHPDYLSDESLNTDLIAEKARLNEFTGHLENPEYSEYTDLIRREIEETKARIGVIEGLLEIKALKLAASL